MSNAILAFPDKTLAATLSGGSWHASFPLNNLENAALSVKARSANALAASTKFDINLGGATKLRALALVSHNFSIAATIQVKFSTVADFATTVYDSTSVNVYPNYYDDTNLDWGQPVLTGNKPSRADAIAMRYPIFFSASAMVTAQYVRVEITDTANTDGYVEIGRCFVAPGLELPRNYLIPGSQWGYETDTKTSKTQNGTKYFNRVEALKTCNFTIPDALIDVGMGQLLDMQRFLNLDQELFLIANPAATSMCNRQQSFLGRLRQLAAYEYYSFNRGDMGFQLVESI